MKKIELKNILDEYEEKASWAYMFGHVTPEEIVELHSICDDDLLNLSDDEEIPMGVTQHIDELASHYDEQWSDVAADTLKEIENIIHKH